MTTQVQSGEWYAIQLFIEGKSIGFLKASGNGYNPTTLKGYVRRTAEWFDESFKDSLLEALKEDMKQFKVTVTFSILSKPRMVRIVTYMDSNV